VEDDTVCRFSIHFYGHECVSDPVITYDTVKEMDSFSMDILGHQCAFPQSTAVCICSGDYCNDDKHSR
ncbi:hypothetical protein TELCIR_23534, partial [Teladorsagia circumcincta]